MGFFVRPLRLESMFPIALWLFQMPRPPGLQSQMFWGLISLQGHDMMLRSLTPWGKPYTYSDLLFVSHQPGFAGLDYAKSPLLIVILSSYLWSWKNLFC